MRGTNHLINDATQRLLEQTEPSNYQSVIWEMFGAWVCSELTDGLESKRRADVWFAVSWLNDFFEEVKAANKTS